MCVNLTLFETENQSDKPPEFAHKRVFLSVTDVMKNALQCFQIKKHKTNTLKDISPV